MISSFHPHSMCKKVERVTQKLDALRVQNGQSLSKYQGFGRKLIRYKGISFLNNLSITKLNIMIKHTNIKHKKKESLKNLFSKLSYSQTSDSHKFQIIQNLNYSNL